MPGDDFLNQNINTLLRNSIILKEIFTFYFIFYLFSLLLCKFILLRI